MSFIKNRPSHLGRKNIYTSFNKFDNLSTLVDVINDAMAVHRENVNDMNILIDYYLGKHSVASKTKDIREEINNVTNIGLPYRAVEEVINYTFGNPVTYTSRTSKFQNELTLINNANDFESKSSIDKDVARMMLITGLGYRAVFPEEIEEPDEQPFRYDSIDPRNCFIIKSTDIGNRPVLAVILNDEIEVDRNNPANAVIYTVYTVYSKDKKWVFKKPQTIGDLVVENYVDPSVAGYQEIQVLGTLPVQEFTYTDFNLGYFEIALDIIDGLDMNSSLTLDDIEQKINSKLVLIGVDPQQLSEKVDPSSETDNTTFGDKVKESEVLVFTGQPGIQQDAKFISNIMDYNGSGDYRDWLESMFYYVLGLPERDVKANGSDTGVAVELRNGWASLDGTARGIETSWYKSERESIKRILKIMKIYNIIHNIKVTDIDIKFSRNKLNNLLVKTQAALNLVSTKLFDPVDIISIIDVSTSPEEMAQRGIKWNLSEIAKQLQAAIESKEDVNNEVDNEVKDEVE